MKQLDEQCAIVTGGASGIGRATVELFVEQGAKVVIADINAADGQMLADEIRANGGEAIFVRCDVTKAGDCQKAVQAAEDKYGRLDI